MTKTVKELFAGIDCTILGNELEEVSGISFASNRTIEGDMFFCIVGLKADGHSFAQDAINRGAKVLVVQRKVYLADASDIVEVVVSDTRKAMAQVACNFYDQPSQSFDLVGVTGTNGKTTTTYLVEHIAHEAGKNTGVIGTVGTRINGVLKKGERTTPESPDLQASFAQMCDEHVDVVAMEVSSHALDLNRTWHTQFAVTAFTNLTQDHLDYHKTFDAYFEAKARLFSADYPAKRAINIDDQWGKELLKRCAAAHDSVVSCGFDPSAQIHPKLVEYLPRATKVELEVAGQVYSFSYPLVGKFNVSNMMLAFACALQLGIPADIIVRALSNVSQVPGRLEVIGEAPHSGVTVFVDYAHTPDAVEKAVASVKEITQGKTIVVFGCGGDRDAAKRPLMGKAALAADFVVVTSDNPRSEDPAAIIEDIVTGMTHAKDRYVVEADRRKAIAQALRHAQAGDSVLIAGKGHEDYQIVGDTILDFDDRIVAAEELRAAFGTC